MHFSDSKVSLVLIERLKKYYELEMLVQFLRKDYDVVEVDECRHLFHEGHYDFHDTLKCGGAFFESNGMRININLRGTNRRLFSFCHVCLLRSTSSHYSRLTLRIVECFAKRLGISSFVVMGTNRRLLSC